MTIPISGHPDWQDAGTWRSGQAISTAINLLPNNDAAFGSGIQTNFAGLAISLIGMNQVGECYIQFGESIPITSEFSRYSFVFPAGNTSVLIPVNGLAFTVHVVNWNTVTNLTGTVKARASNIVSPKPMFYTPKCYTLITLQSVANGATIRTSLAGLMPGPAQLNCNSGNTAGNTGALVGIYNDDGSVGQQIAEFDPVPNTFSQVVYLPDRAVWLAVFNQSGAAVTMEAGLFPTGGVW
jgi:hypothetical protein